MIYIRLQGVPTLCYISQPRQQRNIAQQCAIRNPSVSLDCDFAFPPEIFEDLSCFWTFLVNVIPEEIDRMMTLVESIAQYIFARGW